MDAADADVVLLTMVAAGDSSTTGGGSVDSAAGPAAAGSRQRAASSEICAVCARWLTITRELAESEYCQAYVDITLYECTT